MPAAIASGVKPRHRAGRDVAGGADADPVSRREIGAVIRHQAENAVAEADRVAVVVGVIELHRIVGVAGQRREPRGIDCESVVELTCVEQPAEPLPDDGLTGAGLLQQHDLGQRRIDGVGHRRRQPGQPAGSQRVELHRRGRARHAIRQRLAGPVRTIVTGVWSPGAVAGDDKALAADRAALCRRHEIADDGGSRQVAVGDEGIGRTPGDARHRGRFERRGRRGRHRHERGAGAGSVGRTRKQRVALLDGPSSGNVAGIEQLHDLANGRVGRTLRHRLDQQVLARLEGVAAGPAGTSLSRPPAGSAGCRRTSRAG